MPNPGLRSNFWVRLPTTHSLEDALSVSDRWRRVQFKKSMEAMWLTRRKYDRSPTDSRRSDLRRYSGRSRLGLLMSCSGGGCGLVKDSVMNGKERKLQAI